MATIIIHQCNGRVEGEICSSEKTTTNTKCCSYSITAIDTYHPVNGETTGKIDHLVITSGMHCHIDLHSG